MTSVLDRIFKEFIKSYRKSHKQMDEVLDDVVIRKSGIKGIFKHYEKTINRAGDNMRRKVLRLYSLKSQLRG
jgi:hypothetical protein